MKKGIEDGQDFEEDADNEEGYEMESYGRDDENNLLDRMAMTSYEVGEGPDIDEENITDQDNNEVEIIGEYKKYHCCSNLHCIIKVCGHCLKYCYEIYHHLT